MLEIVAVVAILVGVTWVIGVPLWLLIIHRSLDNLHERFDNLEVVPDDEGPDEGEPNEANVLRFPGTAA